MALASAGCEMPSSSYTAGPRPQLPGLWAAELASVASTQALQRDGWRDCEAGGSGRRGWARARNRLARSAGGCARARRARAWQAEQARHMVNPRCRDAGSRFPRSFRPSNRRKRRIAHVMELAKLAPTFFVADSVVFARYSDFRYLVVWVCIPGLVNGTASATRAPCGQSP